ncbi:hypothetical protein OAN83_01885 [Alphaproteobacteria bacterium]|nr:hypothetical protein [Alphaproteobacteria bacterium]
MEKILLLGGGGHCRSLIDNIISSKNYEIVGILDPKIEKERNEVMGFPLLSSSVSLSTYRSDGIENLAIGVGSKGNNLTRLRLFEEASTAGFFLPSILHKTAYISEAASVSAGCQIFASCVLNANSVISSNTVINSHSVVEHDSFVGKNVFTGPGVVICGSVMIEKNCFVGANSTITPNSVVKAGSFLKANTLYT